MYLYPAVDPNNEENWWTVTDPARVVSGAMDDFVAEYTKPVIPPRENMRAYPSYKPQVQRLYMSLDVEWEAEWSDKDWLSFGTFSQDGNGNRIITFNLTKNTGFHFGHTYNENSNINIFTKPLPYEFHAPLEERIAFWEEVGKPEICGEPFMSCTGCISQLDLETFGISTDEDRTSKQRNSCCCLALKHELLSNKTRCSHKCLYCYWQDK